MKRMARRSHPTQSVESPAKTNFKRNANPPLHLMKRRHQNSPRFAARALYFPGICAITFCVVSAGQAMAQLTWNGGTNTARSNNGNWLDTATLLVPSVPVNGTILNFGGLTYGATVN